MTYTIRITELMEREIQIDAENEVDALSKAMNKYEDRKYVLFPGIHVSTDFSIVEEAANVRIAI